MKPYKDCEVIDIYNSAIYVDMTDRDIDLSNDKVERDFMEKLSKHLAEFEYNYKEEK